MQDLTLLIQLFGREAIDRLSGAGFGTPRAIVRAGPERLAVEGGFDLPLACRIVSAALEAMAADDLAAGASVAAGMAEAGVAAADAATPGGAPAPRRAGRTERKSRTETPERPARRPLKPEAESLASAPESARAPALDGDPLIDDAGLVSWMGFSSRAGMGRAMSFTVSDAILDGGPPAVAPPGDRQPAGEPRVAGRATAAPSRVIDGSFWSFGLRPEEAIRLPSARPGERNDVKRTERRATDGVAGSPAGHGTPRRRRHDEQ